MPLADMGLVSRFDPADLAAHPGERPSSQHVVRCVAGFYGEAGNADRVAATLRMQFGVPSSQVVVIHPSGLTRDAFQRLAARWQSLRPAWGWGQQLLHVLLGAVTGLVTGGTTAALAWSLAHDDEAMVQSMSWLVPGLWAGALAGAVTAALMMRRQPRHRFDDTVVRKLRRGYCVVVAHGLAEHHEALVLAYLQDTSHSWCAEAPQREQRL